MRTVQPRSDLSAARAEAAAYDAALAHISRGDRRHHNVDLVEMGNIGRAVVRGEVEYRAGNHDAAFGALEEAVRLFDALPYDEPHGWIMSVRQTLGALLTEQGRLARAIELYDEDLALFPRNPWALAGLARCLRRASASASAGEVKAGEVVHVSRLQEVEAALEVARAKADVPVGASCACALRDWAEVA